MAAQISGKVLDITTPATFDCRREYNKRARAAPEKQPPQQQLARYLFTRQGKLVQYTCSTFRARDEGRRFAHSHANRFRVSHGHSSLTWLRRARSVFLDAEWTLLRHEGSTPMTREGCVSISSMLTLRRLGIFVSHHAGTTSRISRPSGFPGTPFRLYLRLSPLGLPQGSLPSISRRTIG